MSLCDYCGVDHTVVSMPPDCDWCGMQLWGRDGYDKWDCSCDKHCWHLCHHCCACKMPLSTCFPPEPAPKVRSGL